MLLRTISCMSISNIQPYFPPASNYGVMQLPSGTALPGDYKVFRAPLRPTIRPSNLSTRSGHPLDRNDDRPKRDLDVVKRWVTKVGYEGDAWRMDEEDLFSDVITTAPSIRLSGEAGSRNANESTNIPKETIQFVFV